MNNQNFIDSIRDRIKKQDEKLKEITDKLAAIKAKRKREKRITPIVKMEKKRFGRA